jgi:hypothetical protein
VIEYNEMHQNTKSYAALQLAEKMSPTQKHVDKFKEQYALIQSCDENHSDIHSANIMILMLADQIVEGWPNMWIA